MGETSTIKDSLDIGHDGRPEDILRRLMLVCIAITAGISGIAIVGWVLNWLTLAGIRTDYIPMALSTALMFIVLSGALLVYIRRPANFHVRKLAGVGVFLVILISLIIFIDFFTEMKIDIEQMLQSHPEKFGGVPTGRMSPITSVNLIVAGSSLLLLLTSPAGKRGARGMAAGLATLVISVGFVIILGYLYGTPLLYGGNIIPVALTTAIVFVFLGIGLIVAAGQDYWPLNSFVGMSLRPRLMRTFFPVTISIVLIHSLFDIFLFPLTDNHALSVSLMAILSVMIVSIVVNKITQSIGGDIDRADTRRKKAEVDLIRSKEFSETVFNSMNDAISVIDVNNFRIIDANTFFLNSYGLKKEDVTGRTCYEITHKRKEPCNSPEDICPFLETLEKGKTSTAEHVHWSAKGEKRHMEIATSPIFDENGKIVNVIHVARDITQRKRAEYELSESEKHYRMLFNAIDEGFCIIEVIFDENEKPIDYRFIEINPSFEKQTGLIDAKGKRMRELAPKHEEQWFEIYGKIALTGQPARFVNYAEQLHRWYDVYAFRLGQPENRQVAILFNDISEHKRAEEALKNSERSLHEAQRLARIGSWQWTLATNTVKWSEELYHINGLDPNSPAPGFEEMSSSYTPESWERLSTVVEKALQSGESYELDLDIVRPDGTIIHTSTRGEADYDASGKIVGLHGTVQDNTRRKKAEDELRKSEEKYRALINDASDAIILADDKGKLLEVNKKAEELLGFTKEELSKMNMTQLHPHEELERTINTFKEIIEKGSGSLIDAKVLRKNGRIVPVDIAGSVIQYSDKKVIQGIFRDITQRKKAEETLHENLRLEAADKAKSEFFANMSHELRTPLNASIGFSELLKMGIAGELNEKQKQYVDNIYTSNKFLLTLINDILDLSKIEAGKIELVTENISLPVTINETLTLIKEKAIKHNVLIKTEFEPGLKFIEADKQRVKQVLFNLLNNAIKFSKDEGGTITITAKKEGDMAKISVSDMGIGIKEENTGKLFQKFEQLDPGVSKKYGGTGLGLAITRQLVELHGGKIQANSRYGEGSTFTFTLPIKAKKEVINEANI
ncbi:MAG: PAS domain S-box protein [Candidatus Methanoperedens sp.]|nr:PAS domain S-box protein [Candidatus Methanoperedens sp.]